MTAMRNSLLEMLAAGAAGLALTGCSGESVGADPDLLWVVFDTTRADHLSCYGYERETTPTVDALAADGLRMENAFAQSSLTPISAASFLTGCLPADHEVRSLYMVGQERLSVDTPTLFEHLQGEGYSTGGFVSAPPMGSRYGFDRGYDRFDDRIDKRLVARGGGNAFQRRADHTTKAALDWISEVAPNKAKPMATFVHFFDAHDASLVPPREFLGEWMTVPVPADLESRKHWRELKAPQNRIELYDAELRFQDEHFAQLLSRLDQLGRLDNTLVCFLADHGEGLGDHDFWTHGLLYQEQLHVPWILSGPGVPSGAVIEARVRLIDVLPTLAELLGIERRDWESDDVDGESIFPLLLTVPEIPRSLYAEVRHAQGDSLGRDAELFTGTLGDWKLIHSPSGGDQLFDLVTDPTETRSVSEDEPETVRALVEWMQAEMSATPRELTDLSPETVEMLRELGYL